MRDERQLDPKELGDHIDRLYRAAWGLCGSREDAEELVQETFANVLRKPRLLRSDDDIGYLPHLDAAGGLPRRVDRGRP
jgi:RNA polymerase sigma-70 factor, ECF subfamily